MDRETTFGSPGDWESSKTSNNVFDQMQEVADAVLAEQEEQERPLPSPEKKRLDSYRIAALTQRRAMVSGSMAIVCHQRQSRKLIRRYNRR